MTLTLSVWINIPYKFSSGHGQHMCEFSKETRVILQKTYKGYSLSMPLTFGPKINKTLP